jgi:hypothetical protein
MGAVKGCLPGLAPEIGLFAVGYNPSLPLVVMFIEDSHE